jgi:hypothetical protein
MDPFMAVVGWGMALAAGSLMTWAVTQVVTGRMVFNPRRLKWSVGAVRLSGLGIGVEALAMATTSLLFGLMGDAMFRSRWVLFIQIFLFLLMTLPVPITQILLEQYNGGRWPFKPPVSQVPPVESA